MKYFLASIILFCLQSITYAENQQSRPNVKIDNPHDSQTSKYHATACYEYRANGRIALALKSCHLATVTPDWNKEEAEQKSIFLYNYGQLLRKNKKYKQAVEIYSESIKNEMILAVPNSKKIGRRYAEMAGALYELKEYQKGSEALDRVLVNVEQFNYSEKNYLSMLFFSYSKKLEDKEKKYLSKIEEMGFIADDFKEYLY